MANNKFIYQEIKKYHDEIKKLFQSNKSDKYKLISDIIHNIICNQSSGYEVNIDNREILNEFLLNDIKYGDLETLTIYNTYKDILLFNNNDKEKFFNTLIEAHKTCQDKEKFLSDLNRFGFSNLYMNKNISTSLNSDIIIRYLFKYLMELENKCSDLQTQIDYSPNGEGYMEARDHWESLFNK